MFITETEWADLEHMVFYKSVHPLRTICNTQLRTLVFIYYKKCWKNRHLCQKLFYRGGWWGPWWGVKWLSKIKQLVSNRVALNLGLLTLPLVFGWLKTQKWENLESSVFQVGNFLEYCVTIISPKARETTVEGRILRPASPPMVDAGVGYRRGTLTWLNDPHALWCCRAMA